MTVFQTIALLLTIAAFGAYFNLRVLRLPASIGLMVFALMLSAGAIGLNYVGAINLGSVTGFIVNIDFSAILLHGILSFLLFAGALHINISELRKYQTIIATLATLGTVIASFITGSLVWWASGFIGLHFSYIYALVFGALIAPTDPVAVIGILKEIRMSKSFRVKIASESLFNDGVGVVMFLVFLELAGSQAHTFSVTDILVPLVWEGLGSVILGLTLGWITFQLLLRIDDYKVEVLLTLALAAGGYCLAEIVHVSAPIAMVVAGLVIGNHGRNFGMSDRTRKHLDMFWELLDEILNAVLFMLMGLEMIVIVVTKLNIAMGLFAIVATLAGRYISVALPIYVMHFRYRFDRGTIPLLTWGGLRGGISIALALSLPPSPEKDVILSMTYTVVVFSVLFQGTTFRHLVRAIISSGKPGHEKNE